MQAHQSVSSLYDHIVSKSASQGAISLLGLQEGQRVWLLSLLALGLRQSQNLGGRLIVVHSDPKVLQHLEALLLSNTGIEEYVPQVQAQQFWGLHRYSSQSEVRRDRLHALHLLAERTVEAPLILASFAGLLQHTAAPADFRNASFLLEKDGEFDLDQLIQRLEDSGYRSVDQVEEAGQYAIRGGLLDVFSPSRALPIRCEFLGDQLISLRSFSPDSQLSLGDLPRSWIVPMWEQLLPRSERKIDTQRLYEALLEQDIASADRQGVIEAFASGLPLVEMPALLPALRKSSRSCLLDYLQEGDTLFFLEALNICQDRYASYLERLNLEAQEDRAAKRIGLPPDRHFVMLDRESDRLQHKGLTVECGDLFQSQKADVHTLKSSPPEAWRHTLSSSLETAGLSFWLPKIGALIEESQAVLILIRQEEHFLRMRSLLQHHDINFNVWDGPAVRYLDALQKHGLCLARGALPQLVWEERDGTLILPEHIIFGESFQPARRSTRSTAQAFRSFQDLDIGAMVVHVDHGIGRYLGMKTMEVGGVRTDFLVLEYADQDRLYLPVHRLNLLQKYSAASDGDQASGQLDKLRSQGWAKRKARAKKAIKDMADQLLRIFAQRKLAQRQSFGGPNDDYYQFEADFPYLETPDQQRAIDDVNADLSSEYPMDRLVCGDVGFGKTEVALRAAMRVVQEGQQVIVLAPTTLLSYQHWETFKARFKRFGAEVGLANRFVKADEIRNNLKSFQEGRLDILVGTHRILSKDVVPKNLGLLIVDEEQRFGVSHKEAIKAIKASCDVLTLTATPIPRSLHMALLGIRDISVITTPPTERLSIRTFVARFDEDLIKKAILQEVKRGGQVFFVHNRVHDILEIQAYLKQLLPDVNMAIAHGQMKENKVESVIIDFIEQKYAVLICTSIIESGIDMPNVNTIIINNADRFGLAQLYQMRGRVGRSNRQSYAYFLTSSSLAERDEARQRLEILAAHQELGVGFQIASYDMELRGTGNLLGGDQSGKMSDVGYELFLDLLEREVANLRGLEKEPDLDPEIKIPVSASLPGTYISKEKQRLSLYKALFSALDLEDINRLIAEMRDRFGPPPEEALNLLSVASLKVILKKLRVAQIQQIRSGSFELRFSQLKEVHVRKLTEATQHRSRHLHLTADFRLMVQTDEASPIASQLKDLIEKLLPLIL